MIGNCWTFALGRCLSQGGSILVRRSDYGWWCHVQYVDKDHVIWEYIPEKTKPELLRLWRGCPPMFYKGEGRKVGRLKYAVVK